MFPNTLNRYIIQGERKRNDILKKIKHYKDLIINTVKRNIGTDDFSLYIDESLLLKNGFYPDSNIIFILRFDHKYNKGTLLKVLSSIANQLDKIISSENAVEIQLYDKNIHKNNKIAELV